MQKSSDRNISAAEENVDKKVKKKKTQIKGGILLLFCLVATFFFLPTLAIPFSQSCVEL